MASLACLFSQGQQGRKKTILFLARISLAREWTLDFLATSDGAWQLEPVDRDRGTKRYF